MDHRKALLDLKAARAPKYGPPISKEQIRRQGLVAEARNTVESLRNDVRRGSMNERDHAYYRSNDILRARQRMLSDANRQQARKIERDTRKITDPKFRERAAVEKAEARVAKLEADLAAARQALQAARAKL